MAGDYFAVYEDWRRDPQDFWARAAEAIHWERRWDKVFDAQAGVYGAWFAGALCNTCYNAVDRHVVAGRGTQTAIIHDSPVTQATRRITYAELQHEVETLAAVLSDFGVVTGDRVIIYMPMIPEAIFAMLACARIGAVHSVVFGGFAAKELATRIEDVGAKLVLAGSCGIEPNRIIAYKPMLDRAIELSKVKPEACLIFQRPQGPADLVAGRDHDWAALVEAARGRSHPCVPVLATDPLYVLYTSGTTGQPKGVVRDNGGHMVALAWTMGNFFGVEPGETFWAASDVGWVVGHSYIVYAPLLHGCTSLLYEGKPVGTPDAGAFWRVIADHSVVTLFTAPTAFRSIKKEDPDAKLLGGRPLKSLRALFLAGERADPDTVKWAERILNVPVIDHWWQTESGWPMVGNPLGLGLLPVKYGSATVPLPGYDIRIVDEAAHEVPPGTMGSVVVKLPPPPGFLPTMWRADERFRDAYLREFPGYYKTADAGFKDEDGYVHLMGRTDDIINVAGHRLSTGAMEEVLSAHPAVAECAVIGARNELKGEVPCGFLVLKAGVNTPHAAIEREVIEMVRERIGPVAAFKLAIVVDRLPKTRSGKILRGTMKKIADDDPWAMPATVDDPAIFAEIEQAVAGRIR